MGTGLKLKVKFKKKEKRWILLCSYNFVIPQQNEH